MSNNILLLYFALPIAIIILSIIFETLINCPIKIAGIVFSILLVFTFAVADETFLIFTILYTILAFIVAWITKQWTNNQNGCGCQNDDDNSCGCGNNALSTASANSCGCSNNDNTTNNTNNTNSCGCRRRVF